MSTNSRCIIVKRFHAHWRLTVGHSLQISRKCTFMFPKQQVTLTGERELIQTVTNCTPAWCMRPQTSGDYVPVSLDAEEGLAIINGPACCSRQFGSIRHWNALGLIRQTEPKYPLLVMRTLCHSLTPLPFWPCRKREHKASICIFSCQQKQFLLMRRREWKAEWECSQLPATLGMVIAWNNGVWKRDLGTSDENMLKAECSLFSWKACCFFHCYSHAWIL